MKGRRTDGRSEDGECKQKKKGGKRRTCHLFFLVIFCVQRRDRVRKGRGGREQGGGGCAKEGVGADLGREGALNIYVSSMFVPCNRRLSPRPSRPAARHSILAKRNPAFFVPLCPLSLSLSLALSSLAPFSHASLPGDFVSLSLSLSPSLLQHPPTGLSSMLPVPLSLSHPLSLSSPFSVPRQKTLRLHKTAIGTTPPPSTIEGGEKKTTRLAVVSERRHHPPVQPPPLRYPSFCSSRDIGRREHSQALCRVPPGDEVWKETWCLEEGGWCGLWSGCWWAE